MSDADDLEVSQVREELSVALGQRYDIQDLLGLGGAGIVFRIVHRASGVQRVAKVLRPVVRGVGDISEEFRSEATRLAGLRHPNLVTVFEQAQSSEIPYFVMAYVDGEPLDRAMAGLVKDFPAGLWVRELRQIVLQLADVLAYLHSPDPPLLHLDVKPENILVSRNHRGEPSVLLLDFGISRFATQESADGELVMVRGTFPMWPRAYYNAVRRLTNANRTMFMIDRKKLSAQLDLHLLGRTLILALDAGLESDPDRSRWAGTESAELAFLRQTADRLDIDRQGEGPLAFSGAAELYRALRRLDLHASRTRDHFDEGPLKLPGNTVRSFGSRARRLTDWSGFQRLRGIKQLGLTYLVYPGAVHTRFEHSVGVFANALEVLDSLSGPSGDHRFRSVVADEELIATALVALFHDIGHYPFAHQFRLGGGFPPHEDLTLEMLKRDDLRRKVEEIFNADVYDAMMMLMRYVNAFEHPGQVQQAVPYPVHYRVLRAIVSSTIDVDKLDYVARDSLHAGVPYGGAVDRERLLASLRIWWGTDGTAQLLLSDKGRVCAEALVFARYLMTSEVYWNHGVRSFAAMLSAAIGNFGADEARSHLGDTDEKFMSWLANNQRSSWFTDLVACRQPYRRAFVHQKFGGSEASTDTEKKLFAILEKAAEGNEELKEAIVATVARTLHIAIKTEHDIVLDVPAGMTRLRGVQVLAEGHEEPGRVGPIFDAIGENFDGVARKARVFVHPSLLEKRPVVESTSAVRKALIEQFQLE